MRLLSDPDGRVARAWGAWDETGRLPNRVTFLLDRTGHVRFVEKGGLAIDTTRTLAALESLAARKK
jgi:peroxiredoxin